MSKSNVLHIADFVSQYVGHSQRKTQNVLNSHTPEMCHIIILPQDLNINHIYAQEVFHSLLYGANQNYNFLIDEETMELLSVHFGGSAMEIIKKKII